jgi:NADH:ubiquinone oxidoreductase subunit 2 (subunit N)
MFFSEAEGAKMQTSFSLTAAVAICAAGTLIVGIAPERILEVLRHCVPGTY